MSVGIEVADDRQLARLRAEKFAIQPSHLRHASQH